MAAEILQSVKGSLTCRKILQQWADGFISLPKEIMLHIFIAHKSPSSTAGIEPTDLGSNGKHDNHRERQVPKNVY
jgi:hypothetical protein